MVKQKNIVLCVILSLITCGIYALYWMACINNDMNELAEEQDPKSGGLVVLLSLITCGIYSLFWMYHMGKLTEKIKAKYGDQGGSESVLYLVLTLFGLGIVSYILQQNTINNFCMKEA